MWMIAVAAAIIALDQASKALASQYLPFEQSLRVIPAFFNLTLIHNKGAAFGLFQNQLHLFLIFSLIAIIIIFIISLRYARKEPKLQILLGLVLGGAFGNLIDRLRIGYVVDFLDFYLFKYHWPAFNVADSAICVGIGILTIMLLNNQQERT